MNEKETQATTEEILKDLGRLEAETEEFKEAVQKCAEKEEVVIGFLGVLGKVIKRLLD